MCYQKDRIGAQATKPGKPFLSADYMFDFLLVNLARPGAFGLLAASSFNFRRFAWTNL